MDFVEILKNMLRKGIRIGWNDGKPFDPYDQERTDGMQDIIHSKEKREQEERDKKHKLLLKKELTTMGFMDSWKNWSQEQWDNWGSKLQPAYNKIEKWDTPDWVKDLAADVWDMFDEVTKKYLYDFIMVTLKKFDEEFAKKLIEEIIDLFTKWFKKKKKDE